MILICVLKTSHSLFFCPPQLALVSSSETKLPKLFYANDAYSLPSSEARYLSFCHLSVHIY